MKFSTKKRNNYLNKAAFGSALFIVSAFALFTARPIMASETSDKKEVNIDSVFTARNVFVDINTSDLEILPKSTRLDMLDYWDVDSVNKKVSNVMDGLSWLENVSPDYLKVWITPSSSLEIKILPGKKGKFAMTVYTVGSDDHAKDSEVRFYDENLMQLDAGKYFELPKLKDFFDIPKGSVTKMKEIEEMIPFPTMEFSANPDNDNLNASLTVEQFVNQDDWNIAKLFVKPSIVYIWHKDKYKLSK